ncbi:MAG: hypothetical protein IT364_05545 [Candidatus Hydrogenedentes bacterium]|nr:hypothetical protein [Candidatus Hydrogenedentota bacterium]
MTMRAVLFLCLWGAASLATGEEDRAAGTPSKLPTVVGPLRPDGNFVSLSHRDHPGNRIGYRFHEHAPLIFGAAPDDGDASELERVQALEKDFASRPAVLVHKRPVREEGWYPQDWTYYIAPAEDGFDLLWVIETKDQGLNEFYCVQQCFRMGGLTNSEWRRSIAETPAFSEYDLWARQEAQQESLTSLSHVHAGGDWLAIPATRENVGYRTGVGVILDTNRTGGEISKAGLEPYKPAFSDQVLDSGLIVRRSLDGQWVCGLFWERATHVTNHHPADCLHAVVNLGPIAPHAKRAIRGKVYWMKASLDEVYKRWQQDFAGGE